VVRVCSLCQQHDESRQNLLLGECDEPSSASLSETYAIVGDCLTPPTNLLATLALILVGST
jgi:hypothetical protein